MIFLSRFSELYYDLFYISLVTDLRLFVCKKCCWFMTLSGNHVIHGKNALLPFLFFLIKALKNTFINAANCLVLASDKIVSVLYFELFIVIVDGLTPYFIKTMFH